MNQGEVITIEFSTDLNNISTDYNYNDSYDYETCCGTVCGQDTSMAFTAVFIPILYTVAVLLGVVGNSLVLVVLWKKKRCWNVTDTFILHLSVADLLLLLTMPLWAVQAAKEWIFGPALCKLVGALFQVNFYCAIFLLACISLDRYLSIVHAVQMYSRRKPWLIQLSCLAVWFFSLLLSIPEWMYLTASPDSRRGGKIECTQMYSEERSFTTRILYHLVGFVIPAIVLLFCYTCILLRLQMGSQSLQKKRAMRVILALVVAFFVCWTPYNIVLIAETIHSNRPNNSNNSNNSSNSSNSSYVCETYTALDIALETTSTLGYLHCCMNPVLYAFVGVKFRRHLLDMARPISSRLKGRVSSTMPRKTSVWSESVDTSQTSAF